MSSQWAFREFWEFCFRDSECSTPYFQVPWIYLSPPPSFHWAGQLWGTGRGQQGSGYHNNLENLPLPLTDFLLFRALSFTLGLADSKGLHVALRGIIHYCPIQTALCQKPSKVWPGGFVWLMIGSWWINSLKDDRVHVVLDLLKKQKALSYIFDKCRILRVLTKALLTCPAVMISEFNLNRV